ncbi:helix-turn-helix domain-containing protein [Robbsia sp. Bb-Pol-6]|uniref:Helix-turn-helix domain-containing protein n=1 Tax=Robbsia betulipollinis TaxID=2981849 RepID=A0ABT3ZNV7_9BURK|nr:helix-turn-helix domain-containing protein [Robbsia betulipollinis]MCY0388231.1 helix-turn-helix domain-containing protein [Robbsia betulipollinis]
MKITEIQVHEALCRAVGGESVRSLARKFGVNESTLRERFSRTGASPEKIRDLAFQLFQAQQTLARLNEAQQAAVRRLVRKAGVGTA